MRQAAARRKGKSQADADHSGRRCALTRAPRPKDELIRFVLAPDGTVGSVGGVPLKVQAARRDGATVFLVPRDECADAQANLPEGLRLIPVTTLDGAVDALRALASGGDVPSC